MTRRRAVALALSMALTLALPSLGVGYFSDDWINEGVLGGQVETLQRAPWDLYRFETGRPTDLRQMQSRGPTPWWALPTVRIAFCRPLASALLSLDHAVAPGRAVWAHAHSIAWFVALVAVASRVLFRAVSPEVASLGALLFASRASHWMTVGWIANRHCLISLTFGLAALDLHLRLRGRPTRVGLLAVTLCLAMALSGGESALGVWAFLAAYEFTREATWNDRARALAGPAALLAVYCLYYRAAGYGASGSGFYLDPTAHPWAFMSGLFVRLPALAADLVSALPADLWIVAPRLHPLHLAVGVASLALLAAVLRRAWPLFSVETRRGLRWMLPATALSMVPLAGSMPSGRLLTLPALGASVCVAALGAARDGAVLPRWARRVIVGLVVVHGALGPCGLSLGLVGLWRVSSRFARVVDTAPVRPGRDVVLVGVGDPLVSTYVGPALRLRGRWNARWQPLAVAPCASSIERADAASLTITLRGCAVGQSAFEAVFRPASQGFRAGEVITLDSFSVGVRTTTAGGAVTRFEARWPGAIESLPVDVLTWNGTRLAQLPLPRVGERIELGARGGLGKW